jgi:hypothetical protein
MINEAPARVFIDSTAIKKLATAPGQIVQDRAVGAFVALAVGEQGGQGALHGFNALRQLIHMLLGDAFDELQAAHIGLAVLAVAAVGAEEAGAAASRAHRGWADSAAYA